jgi:hypothetical protein
MKVDRDREPNRFTDRRHEMIVQSPVSEDPQISERQFANISEALHALEHQAAQEALRLRALNTVNQMGEHVLAEEAA